MEKDKRVEELNLLTHILTLASAKEPGEASRALLSRFGSFSAVFEAAAAELEKTPGISHNTALLIRLFPQLTRRILLDKHPLPKRVNQAGFDQYLLGYYFGRTAESLLVFAAGKDGKILSRTELEGQAEEIIFTRLHRLLDFAVSSGAAALVIAHNHPGGFAIPSGEDYEATERLYKALQAVDVKLSDHLIIAEGDYVSMAQSGSLDYIEQRSKTDGCGF